MRHIFSCALAVAIACACCLLPGISAAYDSELPEFAVFGGFVLGVETMPVDELNGRLENAGADQFNLISPTLGLRASAIVFERVLVGGSLTGNQQRIDGDDLSANLSTINAAFDFGYVVYQRQSLLLSPVLSIGWGGVYLDIAGDTRELDFVPRRLRDPDGDFLLSRGAMTAYVGVRGDYLFKLYRQNYIFGGIALSADLGYKYTPFVTSWYDEGQDSYIQGGPNVNFNGACFDICISFGGGKDKSYIRPQDGE